MQVGGMLAQRANALTAELERDILHALDELGKQASASYIVHKDLRGVAKRVVRAVNVSRWVKDRLQPLLRNHAARVAGDTQRVLNQALPGGASISDEQTGRLERQSGRHLNVKDIEPQVRDAIMQAIEEAHAEGQNPEVAARRIRQMVPAGRFTNAGSQYRARLIARTETLHMQRLATLAAYQNHRNIQQVKVRDGVFGPPRSDSECIARSGEVLPLDEAAALAPELHPMCTVSYDPVVGEP